MEYILDFFPLIRNDDWVKFGVDQPCFFAEPAASCLLLSVYLGPRSAVVFVACVVHLPAVLIPSRVQAMPDSKPDCAARLAAAVVAELFKVPFTPGAMAMAGSGEPNPPGGPTTGQSVLARDCQVGFHSCQIFSPALTIHIHNPVSADHIEYYKGCRVKKARCGGASSGGASGSDGDASDGGDHDDSANGGLPVPHAVEHGLMETADNLSDHGMPSMDPIENLDGMALEDRAEGEGYHRKRARRS